VVLVEENFTNEVAVGDVGQAQVDMGDVADFCEAGWNFVEELFREYGGYDIV
jgi:hypothetical protein